MQKLLTVKTNISVNYMSSQNFKRFQMDHNVGRSQHEQQK